MTPTLRPLAALMLMLAASAPMAAPVGLDYLGQATLATGTQFAGTQVGGLSGIDYDAATQTYIAISDDRSQLNPARYYRMTLDTAQFQRANNASAAGVQFTGVTTLRNLDGQPFAAAGVDPESIRLVRGAKGPTLLWTSEGQRSAAGLQNPTLREMHLDGTPVRGVDVPATFLPAGTVAGNAAGDRGVRNNLAFESLTLSTDGTRAYVATEGALVQDGPAATLAAGSYSRVAEFNLASGQAGAQYVYRTDAIVAAPAPGGFSDNGLVEMLAVSEGRFIAMERSFSTGVGFNIRLYLTDTVGASDVSSLASLQGASFSTMRKSLLLDLGTLRNDDGSALVLDNIEGITWGADVGGRKTLMLVADNNFSTGEFTQFVALGVNGDLALAPVPEPSTYALMLGGLALMGAVARRRKRGG
ncbi:esterase-like activity of phytase family protein [Aquincola sp. J276]|nr:MULTISPECIES: esterase-like activity of phytase family protein [Aquincola]MCR5865423.1 esterase-like activity of phytase family protein [Aquincola sp. J276]